jgi:glycosyltransferase involved in cell wall biosynthesis
MGQKLVEGGVDPQKVRHLLYTVRVEDYPPRFDSDDYFLYYGRLSEEKGLLTLLKAMEGVSDSQLRIAGEGPYRPALEAYAREQGLDRVEFVGALGGDALKTMVTGAQFVVVPSEWYENSPLVIYESFSMGKPVIGARIGGISELIEHGVDGFLFEAGNVQELRQRITYLVEHKKERTKMGRAARKKAEKEIDFHSHYPKIMEIYSSLVGNQRAS